jgi:hypothetical protein
MHQHVGPIVREIRSFPEKCILGELMIVYGILMKTLNAFWHTEVAFVRSLLKQYFLAGIKKRLTKDCWGTNCIKRRS